MWLLGNNISQTSEMEFALESCKKLRNRERNYEILVIRDLESSRQSDDQDLIWMARATPDTLN
jgi:hypothetical protein